MPSKPHTTALAIVAAFNEMDIPTILSHRHPSALRTFVPASLGAPQSKTAYASSLHSLRAIFKNFSLVVNDMLEDKEARKICLWCSARADTVVGEYVNEYVWLMEFDEEGLVMASKEYSDTAAQREFWPRLKEAMGRGQREEEEVVGKEAQKDPAA